MDYYFGLKRRRSRSSLLSVSFSVSRPQCCTQRWSASSCFPPLIVTASIAVFPPYCGDQASQVLAVSHARCCSSSIRLRSFQLFYRLVELRLLGVTRSFQLFSRHFVVRPSGVAASSCFPAFLIYVHKA